MCLVKQRVHAVRRQGWNRDVGDVAERQLVISINVDQKGIQPS